VPQAILELDMCELRKTPSVNGFGNLLNIKTFCLTRIPGPEVRRRTIRFHQLHGLALIGEPGNDFMAEGIFPAIEAESKQLVHELDWTGPNNFSRLCLPPWRLLIKDCGRRPARRLTNS